MHTTEEALQPVPRDLQRPIMAASLAVAFLMLVGKLSAWGLTGSAAILSDAMESVVHLFATAFAAFSLWYSTRPPDETHPYGHGKIAYFSSGFEGGLILLAAVTILYTAVLDLIRGPEVEQLSMGMLITGVLMLINLALGVALIRIGRSHHSMVVEANGKHVLTDMWTSLGVLIGVGLVWATDIVWLDPVTAIIVALQIVWTALGLIRQSVLGLMEQADPADQRQIEGTLDAAVSEGLVTGWHELRHRHVNQHMWVEYHLLFNDDLTVTEAHDRAHGIDVAIREQFPHRTVVVTAHMEPSHGHDDAHPDGHETPASDAAQG